METSVSDHGWSVGLVAQLLGCNVRPEANHAALRQAMLGPNLYGREFVGPWSSRHLSVSLRAFNRRTRKWIG